MVHVPHCKALISPSILLQFRAHLNLCDSAHLTLWSAFLIGFFTFFRTANLVPCSLDTFSARTALSRGSISFTSSGTLLTVMHTKTRQSGNTALVVPVPHIPGSPLCPMFALQSLLHIIRAPATYPLFTFMAIANQLDCIAAKSINDGIKHLASLASFNPQDFSGHSLSRGGATFAFTCGIPAELIKLQGDWRSDAYMLY